MTSGSVRTARRSVLHRCDAQAVVGRLGLATALGCQRRTIGIRPTSAVTVRRSLVEFLRSATTRHRRKLT